ncbi:MAG TPA: DNA-processing protein DprA [Candidatus Paceibacterota bacterium]
MNDSIYEIPAKQYPETLLQQKNGPRTLFARGKFTHTPDTKYVCVIGARHYTKYGEHVVNKLIEGLRGYPIVIVSGLALGIDSIAHYAAIHAGLKTIAFPGSTLEWSRIQPRQHEDLARHIVETGGTLLSPWRVGYQTGSWCFPARNRLMAAISHATLVIEAAKGSGSLLTAQHAEELGRDVFAVPGSILSANSYGPHMLIRQGAACIRSSTDILRELGFDGDDAPSRFDLVLKTLSPHAQRVAQVVALGDTTVDQLLERLDAMTISDILASVSELELAGIVRSYFGVIKLV